MTFSIWNNNRCPRKRNNSNKKITSPFSSNNNNGGRHQQGRRQAQQCKRCGLLPTIMIVIVTGIGLLQLQQMNILSDDYSYITTTTTTTTTSFSSMLSTTDDDTATTNKNSPRKTTPAIGTSTKVVVDNNNYNNNEKKKKPPVVVMDSTTKSSISTSSSLSKYHRIYCIIPFLWQPPKSTARYDEILLTWGKRCDVIKFMIDPIIGSYETGFIDVRINETARAELLSNNKNIQIINMTRPWNEDCFFVNDAKKKRKGDVQQQKLVGSKSTLNGKVCRHLWEKMWRTWVYIYENELSKADWFVKIDWDTYFFPNNLRKYLTKRNWSSNELHFTGHTLHHLQSRNEHNLTMIAGTFEILSKGTVQAIGPYLQNIPPARGADRGQRYECRDRSEDAEDLTIAYCLREKLGLIPEPARDVGIEPMTHSQSPCDYISVQQFQDYLEYNRSQQGEWWFWKNKHPSQRYGCLMDEPIGFHDYKRLGLLYDLENYFYDTNWTAPSFFDMPNPKNPSKQKSLLEIKIANRPRAIEYIAKVKEKLHKE